MKKRKNLVLKGKARFDECKIKPKLIIKDLKEKIKMLFYSKDSLEKHSLIRTYSRLESELEQKAIFYVSTNIVLMSQNMPS